MDWINVSAAGSWLLYLAVTTADSPSQAGINIHSPHTAGDGGHVCVCVCVCVIHAWIDTEGEWCCHGATGKREGKGERQKAMQTERERKRERLGSPCEC